MRSNALMLHSKIKVENNFSHFSTSNHALSVENASEVDWAFSDFCIAQTHVLTHDPTPAPTNPPTMLPDECNRYRTRTAFTANGIDNIQFGSLATASSASESDWLFSVDTLLFFASNATETTWLDIDVNFNASRNAQRVVQTIVVLADGDKFSAVHLTSHGLSFFPACGQPLQTWHAPLANSTLEELFADPLADWDFVRTADYWQAGDANDLHENPPVFDAEDVVLKYLSEAHADAKEKEGEGEVDLYGGDELKAANVGGKPKDDIMEVDDARNTKQSRCVAPVSGV